MACWTKSSPLCLQRDIHAVEFAARLGSEIKLVIEGTDEASLSSTGALSVLAMVLTKVAMPWR
ncbi:MAG TPA: hypothetical protein VHZ74_02305 [Bryobacteraceae bacterium]|jgi:hypothetical protein|nr:hypothetical protein [Bryobacteraceae bacterium]